MMTLVMLTILQTAALNTGWKHGVEMAYNAFSADILDKDIGFNNDKKSMETQKCYVFWKNHNEIVKSSSSIFCFVELLTHCRLSFQSYAM